MKIKRKGVYQEKSFLMLWVILEQQGGGNEALVAKRVDLVIWQKDRRWSLVSRHGNRQLALWSPHFVLHMDRMWEKMLVSGGSASPSTPGVGRKGMLELCRFLVEGPPLPLPSHLQAARRSCSFQGS